MWKCIVKCLWWVGRDHLLLNLVQGTVFLGKWAAGRQRAWLSSCPDKTSSCTGISWYHLSVPYGWGKGEVEYRRAQCTSLRWEALPVKKIRCGNQYLIASYLVMPRVLFARSYFHPYPFDLWIVNVLKCLLCQLLVCYLNSRDLLTATMCYMCQWFSNVSTIICKPYGLTER